MQSTSFGPYVPMSPSPKKVQSRLEPTTGYKVLIGFAFLFLFLSFAMLVYLTVIESIEFFDDDDGGSHSGGGSCSGLRRQLRELEEACSCVPLGAACLSSKDCCERGGVDLQCSSGTCQVVVMGDEHHHK